MLIITGCLLLGIYFGKKYRQRLDELRELERILNYIQGEIKYKHSILSDAFFNVSERCREPFRSWLSLLGEALTKKGNNESFFDLWEISIEYLKRNSALKDADYKELFALGQAFSNADIESQDKSVCYEREIIHSRVIDLDKDMGNRMKTSVVFGGLTGILIVVILL